MKLFCETLNTRDKMKRIHTHTYTDSKTTHIITHRIVQKNGLLEGEEEEKIKM